MSRDFGPQACQVNRAAGGKTHLIPSISKYSGRIRTSSNNCICTPMAFALASNVPFIFPNPFQVWRFKAECLLQRLSHHTPTCKPTSHIKTSTLIMSCKRLITQAEVWPNQPAAHLAAVTCGTNLYYLPAFFLFVIYTWFSCFSRNIAFAHKPFDIVSRAISVVIACCLLWSRSAKNLPFHCHIQLREHV